MLTAQEFKQLEVALAYILGSGPRPPDSHYGAVMELLATYREEKEPYPEYAARMEKKLAENLKGFKLADDLKFNPPTQQEIIDKLRNAKGRFAEELKQRTPSPYVPMFKPCEGFHPGLGAMRNFCTDPEGCKDPTAPC